MATRGVGDAEVVGWRAVLRGPQDGIERCGLGWTVDPAGSLRFAKLRSGNWLSVVVRLLAESRDSPSPQPSPLGEGQYIPSSQRSLYLVMSFFVVLRRLVSVILSNDFRRER